MTKKNKNLLLIHGAWSSRNSFNFITNKIKDNFNLNTIQYFEYDCQSENPEEILERCIEEYKKLRKNGDETIIVGHSLGGILALYMSKFRGVSNVITIASPINGVDSLNTFMYYFLVLTAPIFVHLIPKSDFIKGLKEQDYSRVDIDIIVSRSGYNLAMPNKESDGIISIESQTSWTPEKSKVHNVDSNHHEILMMPRVVSIIKGALNT